MDFFIVSFIAFSTSFFVVLLLPRGDMLRRGRLFRCLYAAAAARPDDDDDDVPFMPCLPLILPSDAAAEVAEAAADITTAGLIYVHNDDMVSTQ